MLLKQIIDQLRKEICDNSRDRADDDAAENVGGVVNHKVIAACSHYENVERADREEPLVLFAEREAERGHTRHSGGGVSGGEGKFAFKRRAYVIPPFSKLRYLGGIGARTGNYVFNRYVGYKCSKSYCK